MTNAEATPEPFVREPSETWFVWTKQGKPPKFAHETEEAAVKEAERLAMRVPGAKFHVMRGVVKISFAPPPKA
mgnify:CR=1 FL=1